MDEAPPMTPQAVQDLFTRRDGSYRFARWGRPIVPVVFGVDEATLSVFKGAIEAVVTLAGHKMAETDPELGANLMLFFFREWAELPQVPNLDRLVPDLGPLCARLQAGDAHHYRRFQFEPDGAIKAVFVFVRLQIDLEELAVQDLAMNEAVQMILAWSDTAFAEASPLARIGQSGVLPPQIAAVIHAGYARVLPRVAQSPEHALRLAARVQIYLDAQGLAEELRG